MADIIDIPEGIIIKSSFMNDMTWSLNIKSLWNYFITDHTGNDPPGINNKLYQFMDESFAQVYKTLDKALIFIRQDGELTLVYPGNPDKEKVIYSKFIDPYIHADHFHQCRMSSGTDGRLYLVNIYKIDSQKVID